METNTMDRKIEKKKGIARAFTKKALPFWGSSSGTMPRNSASMLTTSP